MNITPNEMLGLLIVVVVLLMLLLLGAAKRRKHTKIYPMCVVFWCAHSNEQFITPVRNLGAAQTLINKINLLSVVEPHIDVAGTATHRLERGIWKMIE
ncbi:hypothetical protein HWB52_gp48 [Pseudomonas phage Littlefix]|uniref:Uncharacterized protein n=1 Tax=Pseudomonas phage Littlefix TaxID=2079289 RepID=A0A2K9VHN8_9CAUD|nr:hypothetical protein HWB52_gp48 [Pseudomonas phage Littlefix]AUV61863.1 hypothetical protein PsPhLittlefix_gp48 [Pseudomonas phage Littlefix]